MMLDILANNDWKRPIYFTGGSYNDSEYIWMKDYLQLDGLVYKLVPIKTTVSNENPYEMGRIDSDLMYNIVKGWEWGNSESADIYHDPETRKNSISFRGNMHRLAEKLIQDGKNDKAEEILKLSLEKMPLDYFGFYSLVEPYILTYYKLGLYEEGNSLFNQLEEKYTQNLNYYSNLDYSENSEFSIYSFADNIITDTERYRTLVESAIRSNDSTFKSFAVKNFVENTEFVKDIYGEYEYYTLLIPFLEISCNSSDKNYCKDLYSKISAQLKDRLSIFSEMSDENRNNYIENIANDILRFSSILKTLKESNVNEGLVENEYNYLEKLKNNLIN